MSWDTRICITCNFCGAERTLPPQKGLNVTQARVILSDKGWKFLERPNKDICPECWKQVLERRRIVQAVEQERELRAAQAANAKVIARKYDAMMGQAG